MITFFQFLDIRLWIKYPINPKHTDHIDGLVQDCGISIANALELLQSLDKPSIHIQNK